MKATLDEAAVVDVLHSYARALDEKDWQVYAALFAADARLVLPWGEPVPQHEIATDTEQKLGRFAATHHMSTNEQVRVDGSTATSRSYVQATHVMHDGSLWILGARYDNDLCRVDGAWRFTTVRLTTVWEMGHPPAFD